MTTKFERFDYFAILLLVLGFGFSQTGWADDDDVERIFFFGDSLSDPGNIFALTGETSTAPYDIIPSAPYAIRGNRFTNGRTWAEVLARILESNRSGKPALVRPGKFGNYAFGGARLRTSESPVPSVSDQINLYLADFGGRADAKALYVLQFGGNDVRDALAALSTIPDADEAQKAAASIIQDAVVAQMNAIGLLYASGARNFLVANAPNVGLTPAVQLAGPEAVFFGGLLSASLNGGTASGLEGLRQALPGISITLFDIAAVLDKIIENPKKFGITNTTSACLIFFVDTNAICRRPGKYVFWDGIHPTAKVHRIAGRMASRLFDDDDDDDHDEDDDD